MALQTLYLYTATALTVLTTVLVLRRKQEPPRQQPAPKPHPLASVPPEQLPEYIQILLAELPNCVILQSDIAAFQQAIDCSWTQPNREIIPACIVRPSDAQQLGAAVAILKREQDRRTQLQAGISVAGFFAIRSGGVNPGLGVSTVQDGVMVDLSKFCEVMPAIDGSTVTVGTGAKWIDVYKRLDEEGLVVIGGRNSPVGVGGLTLQGGISFYSPRFGFVCSNAVSYEVVLANGSVVTASASSHPELWRVLKGGSSNFGIVTRFTLRSLPSAPLWAAQIIAPASFQHAKAIKAYHDYLSHASSGAFDENAAGPIMSFVYVKSIGLKLISINLVYTKAPEDKQWPVHWKETGFPSLWSFYRSHAVESHTTAVERFGRTAPPGARYTMGTTTIRNDAETMRAAYAIFCQTTTELRHVKGLLFPFVFQTILPSWANKGFPNVLGLEGCTEPLIIISCAVTWANAKDDEFVRSAVRRTLEQVDAAAVARQANHPYRFMNYCTEWQRPYQGCGEENVKLMREASQEYDPDGLFQKGCTGGFKLDFS
ncbi:Bifunctional solanapyrone synthase [Lachnellula subtilissima]|uniref:Bifunctional solanapyrone synthase n=1 Tax=Lachnellula subtilissima TaxID=602034 RepID=A0A8H8RVC5_9HELO|nr:Bifunctional solanapyrone synthase [Lachnellula subtilissima]